MKRVISSALLLIATLLASSAQEVTTIIGENDSTTTIVITDIVAPADTVVTPTPTEEEHQYTEAEIREIVKKSPPNIVVNKRQRKLSVITPDGRTLGTFPICASRNLGQKRMTDDCRTPEGLFGVTGIYPSSSWRYKGTGAKCYGPWFIRVRIPGVWGIGIHGTNAPGSIPGRHSHGCIRMQNADIVKVKNMVSTKSRILILSDDPATEAEQLAELKASFSNPYKFLTQPDKLARPAAPAKKATTATKTKTTSKKRR